MNGTPCLPGSEPYQTRLPAQARATLRNAEFTKRSAVLAPRNSAAGAATGRGHAYIGACRAEPARLRPIIVRPTMVWPIIVRPKGRLRETANVGTDRTYPRRLAARAEGHADRRLHRQVRRRPFRFSARDRARLWRTGEHSRRTEACFSCQRSGPDRAGAGPRRQTLHQALRHARLPADPGQRPRHE